MARALPIVSQMRRCVLCGRASSGKSSLLYALRHGTSRDFHSDATIGVAHMRYRGMDVWDTAGQEQYRALLGLYFRNAHAALVVFDLTHRASFNDVAYWAAEVRKHAPDARLLLVGAKADLPRQRVISEQECHKKAEDMRAQYWETSARTGAGVSAPFRYLLQELPPPPPPESIALSNSPSLSDWSTAACCGGSMRFAAQQSSGGGE